VAPLTFNDLTFIVPFRIDCEDRKVNLRKCLDFFEKTGCKFVVCEGYFPGESRAGFESTISGRLTKVFTYLSMEMSDFFHKTRLANHGLKFVETEFFGLLDCDMICQYAQLAAAMTALRERLTDFIYPYDGRFVEVPRALVSRFIAGSLDGPTDFRLLHTNSSGGLIMGRTESYRSIGGENENFRSWGPEDMERHNRILKLGLRLGRINGPIFHMEHERGKDSCEKNPYFRANNREFARMEKISVEDLRSEINDWPWKGRLWK
jgi:hypothetical protein